MRALVPVALLLAHACAQGQTGPDLLQERPERAFGFVGPDECASCHPQHARDWEISNHAYAMRDPVFHAMVRAGQRATEGKLGQFCVQCHSPVALAQGESPVVFDEDRGHFVQQTTAVGAVAARGVSCDVCHSITNVIEPRNARAVLTPDGVKRATIEDPVPTHAHESAASALHGESRLCSMCHAVVNGRGALIEETFGEWQESSVAARGKQCQDCHMPTYEGRAAADGPVRVLHRHTFVGVDVSLLAPEEFPGYDEMRELTKELLQSAAVMEVQADGSRGELRVSIENLAGHALPSGATAERQMWLEVIVVDADGAEVFASGTLDENGDIRDGVPGHSLEPGSDPQLAYHGQQLLSVAGLASATGVQREDWVAQVEDNCVSMGRGAVRDVAVAQPVAFPWQADWQCNYMIRPDETVEHRYDLAEVPSGDYQVRVRLLFRTFPPYFLRELEVEGGLDPAVATRVPTVVMASDERELTISR